MPRVIVKCRYYQTAKTHKDVGGLMNYIATREGVDKRTEEWKNQSAAAAQTEMILASGSDLNGLNVITYKLENVPADMPRSICDELKARDENVIAVISLVSGGRLTFACCCGRNAVSRGAHAGNILKKIAAITGGGGGGRPDSASSGGKDVSKLDEALKSVPEIVKQMI